MGTDIAIIGSGPAGYSVAFRAADLGKKVTLIECRQNLGGVCINDGCIPTKALLYVSRLMEESKEFSKCGVDFGTPKVDIKELAAWKNLVVNRLNKVLAILAKQKNIAVISGTAKFASPNRIVVGEKKEEVVVDFQNAVIATGSRALNLAVAPKDDRIVNSTDLLDLKDVPKELLVVGGGAIGLEMAAIYNSLGSKITIVELDDHLLSALDEDLSEPIYKNITKKYKQILLGTKITKMEAKFFGIDVTFQNKSGVTSKQRFNKVLVAIGRIPNSESIDANKAGVELNDKGFIIVDAKYRTSAPHIYAIGDVISNPMLAHKAIFEGRLVGEIIAGYKDSLISNHIPNVIYTDPGVATVGVLERDAQHLNIKYTKKIFRWSSNGRSLTLNSQEGLTKLIFESNTHKLIGGAIVGSNSGELVSEIALAIENKLTAEDIAQTIHPHPALSETIKLAAEDFLGIITDYF